MNGKVLMGMACLLLAMASAGQAADLKGRVLDKDGKPLADAVVYLTSKNPTPVTPPSKPAVIDQVEMTFVPHVLPVVVGTTVEFLNSEKAVIRHNVFSPTPCADRFNLGYFLPGQKASVTFKKPCRALILCATHQEMKAWVVVLETPYFAKTDAQGNYSLSVPPGEYTLAVWHETRKTEHTQPLKVSANQTLDIRLP